MDFHNYLEPFISLGFRRSYVGVVISTQRLMMKNLGDAARVAGVVRLMASITNGAMAKERKKPMFLRPIDNQFVCSLPSLTSFFGLCGSRLAGEKYSPNITKTHP